MTFPHNVNNADIFYNIICIILPSLCRAMMDSHYIAGTCKQHASSEHLGQDAARRPHVDGLGVVLGGQEETGGAVPLGHQTLGQIALSGVKEKEEDTAEVVRIVSVLNKYWQARRQLQTNLEVCMHDHEKSWANVLSKLPQGFHHFTSAW